MQPPPPLQSGRPRHEQISDWLRTQLSGAQLAPHEQLPSEHELSQSFGVSRITIRRALGTLENEGLIYRRQGLGSFAAPPRVPQGLVRLTDFAQDMERAGYAASSQVLHRAPEPVPAFAAGPLGLDPGATVVRLDRLRLGDGLPFALDHTWLPPFYAQLLEGHDLNRQTIYSLLEQHYQIPVLRGHYRIEAVLATPAEAGPLGVARHAPLLLVERTSLTAADRPVYVQRRYYRADRVAFELELARDQGVEAHAAGMPLQEFEPVFKAETS
ncbi:MAG: GntR family transcriptional regulator [Bacteroidota bacterium]